MTKRSPPSAIAPSGHSAWQAPQRTHSSVTRWLTPPPGGRMRRQSRDRAYARAFRALTATGVFWQLGQTCVPRPLTRMWTIGSPHVVHGSPQRW